MINTHALGVSGEQKAVKYLIENQYQIVERNYLTKLGEIDIIAKKDNVIVFIEVKQKESLRFGYPREMITSAKIDKIRKTALLYLTKNKKLNEKTRFDCIEIVGDKITHLKNCF